jgi:hypothetical protein
MRRKYFLYAISFFHSKGNGCVQLYRKKKINTLKEFYEARDFIASNNNLENVVIINIMLICKERR